MFHFSIIVLVPYTTNPFIQHTLTKISFDFHSRIILNVRIHLKIDLKWDKQTLFFVIEKRKLYHKSKDFAATQWENKRKDDVEDPSKHCWHQSQKIQKPKKKKILKLIA